VGFIIIIIIMERREVMIVSIYRWMDGWMDEWMEVVVVPLL
jgi:hypothetical protein